MTGRKEKQMITSKYEWQFAAPFSDDTFLAQAKKRGLEASAAKLLGERGIQTEEALDRFLEPRLEDLHDPYLLHDMDKAVDRIRQGARRSKLFKVSKVSSSRSNSSSTKSVDLAVRSIPFSTI